MTPDDFRKLGYEIIDFIADYRTNIRELPVWSQAKPGDVRGLFPSSAPERPEDMSNVVAELEKLKPGLSHFQHPRYFGYFPSNAELSSVLGDLLSSGLGQLGLNWQSSPALTELEEVTTEWLRQLLALPESFKGVIHDTASTASLVALICAREWTTQHSQAKGGLQAQEKPLIVYVSSQSHSSVEKAALLAGFGRDNLQLIDTDENHAIRMDVLEGFIKDDLAKGLQPCALVAATGTTATTAFDNVAAMARLAKEHNLWLHVDAAMAGSAMLLPECRHLWQGVEQSHSVVLNPHKWLGAVFDCTLFYTPYYEHLIRVMSTNPSYLQTSADGQATNYRDWGIPLGRRFRALKLWFLLKSEGAEGLRQRLRRDLENAKWLETQVRAVPNWKVVAPVQLQTVCLRYDKPGLTEQQNDDWTLEWVNRLNTSGQAYVTPAKLKGCWMVRVSVGSLLTQREDVAALWQLMRLEAET
ncbi:MAG: pyridoxal phosphate-dependent decarboxylase family protein [Trueperaceae bacterium]